MWWQAKRKVRARAHAPPRTVSCMAPTLVSTCSCFAAEVLQPLSGTAEGLGVKMVMHVKPKSEDGSTQFRELITAIQAAEDVKDPLVGTLPKDKHSGKFVEAYNTVMSESGLSTVDVAPGFADLLAVKDAGETMNHKKAAMLAARVMKDFVLTKIETIIDEGKSVKHSKLTEQTEQVILEPAKIGVKLKSDNCDIAYPPIFQSGGKYDLKVCDREGGEALTAGDGLGCKPAAGALFSAPCSHLHTP